MGYVGRSTSWLALYTVGLMQTQNKYKRNSLSCKFSFLSRRLNSVSEYVTVL